MSEGEERNRLVGRKGEEEKKKGRLSLWEGGIDGWPTEPRPWLLRLWAGHLTAHRKEYIAARRLHSVILPSDLGI